MSGKGDEHRPETAARPMGSMTGREEMQRDSLDGIDRDHCRQRRGVVDAPASRNGGGKRSSVDEGRTKASGLDCGSHVIHMTTADDWAIIRSGYG